MFYPREPSIGISHQHGPGNDRLTFVTPLSALLKAPGRGVAAVVCVVVGFVCVVVLAFNSSATRTSATRTVPGTLTPGTVTAGVIHAADSVIDSTTSAAHWATCGAWSLCATPSRVWTDHGDRYAEFTGTPGSWGVLRACDSGQVCELTNNSGNDKWCLVGMIPTLRKGRGPCPNV
jgi:hypothetical protein